MDNFLKLFFCSFNKPDYRLYCKTFTFVKISVSGIFRDSNCIMIKFCDVLEVQLM